MTREVRAILSLESGNDIEIRPNGKGVWLKPMVDADGEISLTLSEVDELADHVKFVVKETTNA